MKKTIKINLESNEWVNELTATGFYEESEGGQVETTPSDQSVRIIDTIRNSVEITIEIDNDGETKLSGTASIWLDIYNADSDISMYEGCILPEVVFTHELGQPNKSIVTSYMFNPYMLEGNITPREAKVRLFISLF